jgi:hypothetical protein
MSDPNETIGPQNRPSRDTVIAKALGHASDKYAEKQQAKTDKAAETPVKVAVFAFGRLVIGLGVAIWGGTFFTPALKAHDAWGVVAGGLIILFAAWIAAKDRVESFGTFLITLLTAWRKKPEAS